MSEDKPKHLAGLKPFKPGESGNPGGKPTGTRNRITTRFLNALADDFDEHGVSAIKAARETDPVGYVKVIAALLPKQVEHVQPMEELTDAELLAGIALLRARLTGDAGAGAQSSAVPTQTH